MNYFYYKEEIQYSIEPPYMPSERYPEYPFIDIENNMPATNEIYGSIRQMFINMELDKNNIGTKYWNPLGEFINPGNTVLIKPNLVKDINEALPNQREGMDCLITHPSIVRVIFDYVYIALDGRGKIIVADAPVQGCDFERLKRVTGYGKLFQYFEQKQTKSMEIIVADLRETIAKRNGSMTVQNENMKKKFDSTVIDLADKSYFKDIQKKNRLRVTMYTGDETVRHHINGKNEYCISNAALEADVIISIPKPKTHRIAGYTAALKNMIGVCARKEYLPHHRKGAKTENNFGDEYENRDVFLKWLNSIVTDIINWGNRASLKKVVKSFQELSYKIQKQIDTRENNWKKFGMWHGNDTIWRTILDINYIINYADKMGKIQPNKQRKILYFGDMVVCGDHEGPLMPKYKKVGGILFSSNPIAFDLFVVKIMGFDYSFFPTLKNSTKMRFRKTLGFFSEKEYEMVSNKPDFNGKISKIKTNFDFVPTSGWKILTCKNV